MQRLMAASAPLQTKKLRLGKVAIEGCCYVTKRKFAMLVLLALAAVRLLGAVLREL